MRTSSLAALLVLSAGLSFGQKPTANDAPHVCDFSSVFQKDGWTIPGLEGATVKRPRTGVTNMRGLFVTMLKPSNPETFLHLVSCPRQNPGRLEIEDAPVKIHDIWSFDMDGQVFAYRVVFSPESIHSDGTRGELASVSTLFFTDTEGSGLFTDMRESALFGGLMPPFIPEWAKNNADTPPAN